MDDAKFLAEVQNRAGLGSHDEAERIAEATLSVLAQRLAGGEPSDLAAQLPPRVQRFLRTDGGGESFGLEEFCGRVAQKEGGGTSPEQAHAHARAVLSVVADAISPGELSDVMAQLPDEYSKLLQNA